METKISRDTFAGTKTPRPAKTSFLMLIRSLIVEIKTLLRQEIDLAKAETTESVTQFVRGAMVLAVGALASYAGLILCLFALAWLVAWALQKAHVPPVLAGFLGFGIIGMLATASGAVVVLRSLKTFSAGSLAPKKTLSTIQRLKGPVSAAADETPPQPASRPSTEEMLNKVEATENRMSDTLDELGQRLSPQQIKARVIQGIQKNPYRSGLLAMGMGLLSGLFLAREFRRS